MRNPKLNMPIITLTTDFGTSDSYVAQLKGAILAINPQAQLIDVTHAVPPQAVSRAAAIMEEIACVFPAGSIHVAVVDPGVGSDRALLAAEAAGQRFLAPDNGLLMVLFRSFPPPRVHRLTDDRFWRKPVSATFHGRDILAPVAAHWSCGADVAEFGPPVNVASLVNLPLAEPRRTGRILTGCVEAADAFGNLISNIREADLPPGDRFALRIGIGNQTIAGISRCYSDHPAGSLLALIGSSGRLEIAVSHGSAARHLNVSCGTEVRVETPGR
jgi:S-adenosylmethionine hydrolase